VTDIVDQRIIRRLQEDFPLTAAPYQVLAQEIGIEETELLERLKQMKSSGVLRKMGAVLQHRNAGFHGNALCCWQISQDRIEAVAEQMTDCPFISHVYLRQPHPKWPYNLYTVFHGRSREQCRELIGEVAGRLGINEPQVMFSRKNWKRSQLILLRDRNQ
jgi:siroheme decarboxylase